MRFLTWFLVLAALAAFRPAAAVPAARSASPRRVAIAVTKKGFEPSLVKVRAGVPVTLVVTRTVEKTCATEIVVATLGIRKALPLHRPVEIAVPARKAGELRFACGMDMLAGKLVIE